MGNPPILQPPESSAPKGIAQMALMQMVRASRRSWWQARYANGRIISEWDTAGAPRIQEMPLPWLQSRSQWEQLDHAQITDVRILCPNGQIGDVFVSGPYRAIQFKVGAASMLGHAVQCHVVGTLTEKDDGSCQVWEWLPETRVQGKLIRPGSLQQVQDNIFNLHKRYGVGAFSLEALNLRV